MNEPVPQQEALRKTFPDLSMNELETLEKYFDLALEIARQDLAGAEPAFDNLPPISNLKERSNNSFEKSVVNHG